MVLKQEQPLVLIIDDQPEQLGAVTALLRAERLRISIATDGRQGYERAQALNPHIILLDVRMPGTDGFAVCRLLKASARTRDIPVIFLSAAITDEERLQGLTQGGVDYVPKPCLPAEVLARIRIHLHLAARTPAPASDLTPATPASHDEVILRAAMRLIGSDLAHVPSLADIAHKVGTHDKRLSAIFRQHLGMTVFAWIRDERLRRARELLADSRMSIQDVADQVGFRNACNLSTAFRDRMGVTPSAFRRTLAVESA
ncbi:MULTISPECIES: response regulator transcription factor [Dyella]|uniref:Response regulator transcription factor n=2 Tax=Dyella TaxID=231454 RepID=A0A4R0YWN1_9GAMM|nr:MULTISPECIES: helix-turn-helix domain-containing protein [Dyella]TBR39453.1 response regulator transcription factor [Dyella terrae]TCI12961.1 response regulator transcription factor [Dyella soli]